MSTLGSLVLTAVAILAMARAFTLQMRFLQDGIAYLRHGRIVMDVAMPIQGVLLAMVAAVGSYITISIDPAYPNGAGILPLAILGAAGAIGLLIPLMYLMQRSSMRIGIEHHQPLFLRDRTPGCTSTRHVTVYVGGRRPRRSTLYRTLHLR